MDFRAFALDAGHDGHGTSAVGCRDDHGFAKPFWTFVVWDRPRGRVCLDEKIVFSHFFMKFFLDTANLDDIKKYIQWGVVDGVTTNPTLVAKEGVSLKKRTIEICEAVQGPTSAEVISTDFESILKEARELAAWHQHVVVKIPMIEQGLKAVSVLSKEGMKINVTLVFSPAQALLAAKAGATYVSPFVGRIDDIGMDGMETIAEIRQIFDNYDLKTQILFASVRHPRHVVEAAKLGCDVATMPVEVLEKLIHHPLTDVGLKKFLEDWEKVSDKQ